MSDWKTVIGLEVHCQLATRTKLFCGCPNEFGAAPNANTCPVCTGQPGALPVLNGRALELAVRAGLALGAELAPRSSFARKNYFYCDLPKGYQISQYEQPYCTGGGIVLASGKKIRLERIHMEEDAGKAIHDRGDTTLVDLNRAGIPLIESVTEADLSSAEEAHEYLTALKEIFQYAGVSDCDMEKGSLRCDVNVSVHREGTPWGTKVELKNLNSFRHVVESIEHEVPRQIALYESGAAPVQETRLYDPDRKLTRSMRSKEDAHDYRYFPDPDLPPVLVESRDIERARAGLPELPAQRRLRYGQELGLSEYDAGVLTSSREVADFFEATLQHAEPKLAANWIGNEVLRALSDPDVPGERLEELPLTPEGLGELLGLVAHGTLSAGAAKKVLRVMIVKGGDAASLVDELGLKQVSDTARIEAWCREVLAAKAEVAEQVAAGNEKAVGALVGPVMQASKGKANPKLVRETLLALIRATST